MEEKRKRVLELIEKWLKEEEENGEKLDGEATENRKGVDVEKDEE